MPPNSALVTERARVSMTSRPARRLLGRFSRARALMVLSALLTFVLIASATGEKDRQINVAVARRDIAAGAVVSANLVGRVELPSKSALVGRMVPIERLGAGKWIATRPIAAGDPVRNSDLAPATDRPGLRAMSIPVKRENAAGGALSIGDRVDVISTASGQPQWVVTSVQVVGVPPSSSSGGLTRDVAAGYYVVVELDADQALALAGALAGQKIEVVRSTGAPVVARPTAPAAGSFGVSVTPAPPLDTSSPAASTAAPGVGQ